MKIVGVTFLNGFNEKIYHFKTDIEDIVPGDLVVVDSQNKPQLAIVECIGEKENVRINPQKWVIDKVDFTRHEERKEKEKELNKIKREMDERIKELKKEKGNVYKQFAEVDSVMNTLYQEYERLMNEV